MQGDLLGVLAVFALALVIAGMIVNSRLPARIRTLLVAGLALRVFGSQFYYYLSEWIYGFGDYSTYYHVGTAWGDALLAGSTESVRSPYLQDWCCTGFTIRLSGLVMIVLGPTVNGAFLTFALAGYAGIVALAVAFARAHPDVPLERYLVWIVFFPSLWYWPAALGKDALMLMGLGLAVLGYVGRRGSTGWLPLAAGLGLMFMVRPQVSVVVVGCMVLAFWVSGDAPWTLSRVVQGVALFGGGILLTVLASGALGVDIFSAKEIESYLDARGSASAYGGSAVETGGGIGGMLMGIVNVLFRPFLWEARGFASLVAALEVTALWALALWKRAEIAAFFNSQRRSRLLWFAIVFTGAYVLLTGMALGNLGLIARQRVHIFPFLFIFFAGRPIFRPRYGAAGHPVAGPARDGRGQREVIARSSAA
jgi:hypothetical protein